MKRVLSDDVVVGDVVTVDGGVCVLDVEIAVETFGIIGICIPDGSGGYKDVGLGVFNS